MAERSSPAIAADRALLPLWDPATPFPTHDVIPDLDIVTHCAVERAQPGGYHYLHESAIASHRGVLHVCWANHPTVEINTVDERIRGRRSPDGGFTWSEAETWVAPPLGGAVSFNHPVLAPHDGRLWGFFARWEADVEHPRTEVFTLNDATGAWEAAGTHIPGFVPFRPPMRLADGNWIMGGERYWHDAAVAISAGDDFTRWEPVVLPKTMDLLFPETALMDTGDRLVACCRPHKAASAPISSSTDGGRTWTPLEYSNFPLAESQPFCGRLSTGQHYLITDNLEEGRTLLSIAVTAPGAPLFSRVWKLRHQAFPRRRLWGGVVWDGVARGSMVGQPTEWSYPAAVEHEGKLYISYTQGKEDCVLSIIPISALAV